MSERVGNLGCELWVLLEPKLGLCQYNCWLENEHSTRLFVNQVAIMGSDLRKRRAASAVEFN